MTLRERFFQKVRVLPDGCWEWTSTTSHGYPVFSVPPSKAIPAARVAWELVRGAPPPARKRIDRFCRNNLCVNPDHRRTRTTEDRFWAFVLKGDGCWTWSAAQLRGGYGQFSAEGGRTTLAHRYSWHIANGPVPDGMDVLHHCDNPHCVRPEHLFLGTDSDNQRDCVEKGRHRPPKAKLTPESVRAIRASRKSALALAAEHGVTTMTIYSIRARKTWRNI